MMLPVRSCYPPGPASLPSGQLICEALPVMVLLQKGEINSHLFKPLFFQLHAVKL